jgi:hypothetical protein
VTTINEPPEGTQAGYRSLQKFLTDRYADTLVLTFDDIESLLGFGLPEPARLKAEWWANTSPDHAASAQSRAWTAAGRTATPRLMAQTVTFHRTSGS